MSHLNIDAIKLGQINNVFPEASWRLEDDREGRVDPLTASTHPDHWIENLAGYVQADIAVGSVDDAKAMVDYWLDRTTSDGRVPHMVLDETDWRRRNVDRYIQKAEEGNENSLISPFLGHPVMSSCALMVANALPEGERKSYAEEVVPRLELIKRYQYKSRNVFYDGLPVQIHPDEVLLRAGRVSEKVLDGLAESKLTDFERFARSRKTLQKTARNFRRWQADDNKDAGAEAVSVYDSRDFMSLQTAAQTYTLWNTTRKNNHLALNLKDSTGRGGIADGFMLQDVAITGMLLADNQALMSLAEMANIELDQITKNHIATTNDSAQLHWDPLANKFASRLPRTESLLIAETGIESYYMLLGGTAITEAQTDSLIKSALGEGGKADLLLPTASIIKDTDAQQIDRGAMSPRASLLIYNALKVHAEHSGEAAVLRGKIGRSIVAGYLASKKFSRQVNSQTAQPIGQNNWAPSAAAVLVVSRDMLS